ncbi:MAG: hypothetical protein KKC68_04420 [Candidatus Thermoplasmatota archaeon]|nr:hypothetical protein [Candidatus Thermoplasmatota archaeon]
MRRGKYKLISAVMPLALVLCCLSMVGVEADVEYTESIDGLPDLIVKDIILHSSHTPGDILFSARVRNIGDATSGEKIDLKLLVTQNLFGLIPIKVIINNEIQYFVSGGIKPGNYIDLIFTGDGALPDFGFIKFRCTVNPNKTVQENNYINNGDNELMFTVFGLWFSKDTLDSIFNN